MIADETNSKEASAVVDHVHEVGSETVWVGFSYQLGTIKVVVDGGIIVVEAVIDAVPDHLLRKLMVD